MIKLYFGSVPSILSTLFIVAFAVFFGWVTARRASIGNWGTLVLVLFIFGLLMSFMSGTKDGIATEASVIPMGHWVMAALCILGGLAFLAGIIALFVRRQEFWQVSFYLLSGIVIAKTLLTEGFRIAAHFKLLS